MAKFVVFGIHHKMASLEIRERFALSSKTFFNSNFNEFLAINTCNRSEIYAIIPDSMTFGDILKNIHQSSKVPSDFLFFHENSDAITHLFLVACGLESQFLGETEILSQIKKAYKDAILSKTVGPILHRIFQKTLQVSKWARTSTEFIKENISLSSIVYETIKEFHSSPKILLIGMGKCGQKILRFLTQHSISDISLSNRTIMRDDSIGSSIELISISNALNLLKNFDVIILAAGDAPSLIVPSHLLNQKNQLIIDLGVPRNTHPDCINIKNIKLYNIEDLANIAAIRQPDHSKIIKLWKNKLTEKANFLSKQLSLRFSQFTSSSSEKLITH